MEKIFLYNLDSPKGKLIRRLCEQMGIPVDEVPREDYTQPIGVVVGMPGFVRHASVYSGPAFTDEMMLFRGFDDAMLSRFLNRYRQAGIDKVDLKASLTPHNVLWNSFQLHDELLREHRLMTGD
ncbi:MAG: DUF3783 domain-containing protein [Bacteroides sp.]